jgi:hypothetical protein
MHATLRLNYKSRRHEVVEVCEGRVVRSRFVSFYCTFLFNKTFFLSVPKDIRPSLGTEKKKCFIK